MSKDRSLKRTEYAERFVERFLSLPFIPEFVFRSPQTLKKTQKEVADLFIAQAEINILVSQKCQEDPSARDPSKIIAWANKAAANAAAQLDGALGTVQNKRPVWCIHPRRGRVDFPSGLPEITHAIVIIEVLERIQLEADDAKFPLKLKGVPVTYLSVNDFLNLANELRTVPEIVEYLNARRSLSFSDLRIIGDEKVLFSVYLLNSGSFPSCCTRVDAADLLARNHEELAQRLAEKAESDRFSGLLEHVAHELATRHPQYAADLPPNLLCGFDDAASRRNYIEMQGVIASLRLRERAELGRAFHGVIQNLQDRQEGGFTYMAAYLDAKPDWVFIFGSSKNMKRVEVLKRAAALMPAAMAQYEKPHCMLIIDRDGESYEVAIDKSTSAHSDDERAAGREFFGRLRIADRVRDGL
jgi:hypothetical protein